ncbi:hypothetical protein VPHK479_0058 [Vibrio phage K479]
MKIDWKFVSQTEGYQSLKAAVNQDKMRWHNTHNEVKRMEGFFRSIIRQCLIVSEHTGIPIDIILSWAEHNRDYWYANYYNHTLTRIVGCDGDIPIRGRRLRPSTIRGELKARKKCKRRMRPSNPADYRRDRRQKLDITRRHLARKKA